MNFVRLMVVMGVAGLAGCVSVRNTGDNAAASKVAPAEVKAAEAAKTGNIVLIKTSKGDIKVELFADKAPETVKNFLQYVDDKHYDGTIFHRVMNDFMIQGGGFTKDMVQKPCRPPVRNEADNGVLNARGTLAMARTDIVDSATSQFFINVIDNAFLNFRSRTQSGFGYCVFGKVIEGMDVVDSIKTVPTGSKGPHQNVPVTPVEIISVTRVN